MRLYHVDRLGSTQVVTDWSGNIYRQVRYAAYGEIRGRFDLWGSPAGYAEDARFEFTGYETDFAGLDYAGARFFDPELAQFASHDPAGQYPSPYAYGPGDPVNGGDPSGELFLEIYAATIVIRAVVGFLDAKNQTGSTREGMKAAGHGAADAATFGIYGGVKAMSSGEYGNYLADFYANRLTLGVYGTAKAFNNEQFAAGVVGAVSSAVAIAGLAQGIAAALDTPLVSGDWGRVAMSLQEAPFDRAMKDVLLNRNIGDGTIRKLTLGQLVAVAKLRVQVAKHRTPAGDAGKFERLNVWDMERRIEFARKSIVLSLGVSGLDAALIAIDSAFPGKTPKQVAKKMVELVRDKTINGPSDLAPEGARRGVEVLRGIARSRVP